MAARIYSERDADLRWLREKTCAVIGFGSQGRAHALNLRDSKLNVLVGLYPTSKSRRRARQSGVEVVDTAEAARRGHVIFLALPDSRLPEVFEKQIAPHLRRGRTLLVAHGFAIHYRTIVPRRDVDVIMMAPKASRTHGPFGVSSRSWRARPHRGPSKREPALESNRPGLGQGDRLHARGCAGDNVSRRNRNRFIW